MSTRPSWLKVHMVIIKINTVSQAWNFNRKEDGAWCEGISVYDLP